VELFCGLFYNFVNYFCLCILDCRTELHNELESIWKERSFLFRGYSVLLGGRCGCKCTKKSGILFSLCPYTSKHKSRMSHLQEPVQQVLENTMYNAIAKEYPMFYETHRFMIVFTGPCLFSTHTLSQKKEVKILFLENAFKPYFPSTANPFKWSLPLGFYCQSFCMLCSQIPCMLHAALISFSFI